MDRRRLVGTLSGVALGWKLMTVMSGEALARARSWLPRGVALMSDAQSARFPPSNVEAVLKRIRKVFARDKPSALVCSGACGADLLGNRGGNGAAHETLHLAGAEPAEFRKTSVTDRPGNWGELLTRPSRQPRWKY